MDGGKGERDREQRSNGSVNARISVRVAWNVIRLSLSRTVRAYCDRTDWPYISWAMYGKGSHSMYRSLASVPRSAGSANLPRVEPSPTVHPIAGTGHSGLARLKLCCIPLIPALSPSPPSWHRSHPRINSVRPRRSSTSSPATRSIADDTTRVPFLPSPARVSHQRSSHLRAPVVPRLAAVLCSCSSYDVQRRLLASSLCCNVLALPPLHGFVGRLLSCCPSNATASEQ